MPIDPSIIGNVMVPQAVQMPDVNAMMQTQTRGMENIYQIETARQEQAAEAAKEAAQQAAEAMLPAVASAFSDPSDAGLDAATSMLPPEVATAFTPFMQRLKGVAPELRKSLLRAELLKDDEGKLILQQLEPTANMRLQEATAGRRAALDERRLALDEAKLAAEAAGGGQPKVSFRETDAAGNVHLFDDQGNEIRVVPGAGKPAAAASTKTQESERLAAYNTGRALNAAKRIASAVQSDTGAEAPGAVEALVSAVGNPNIVRSENRQIVSAAQRELIDALLTLATGAAYNKEQLEGQMESYVPKWSDKPGTRADKRRALLDLIASAKIKSGSAWTPEMDQAFNALLAGEGNLATQETTSTSAPETTLPEGATTSNW